MVSSIAIPQTATNATVVNRANNLTLEAGSGLYLFAMSVGGEHSSSGFYMGSFAKGLGSNGQVASAIAVTNSNKDNFTTADSYFTIGGVGISGFGNYNATYGIMVPPVEPTTTFSYSFNVSGSATVLFLLTAGGQCCITASGVPGLSILAAWNAGGGVGLEIAEANLTEGHYTITEQSTNNDGGSNTRANIAAVFQFYPTSSTSSPPWVLISVIVIVVAAVAIGVVVVLMRKRPPRGPPAT